jgi:hypothetical protein
MRTNKRFIVTTTICLLFAISARAQSDSLRNPDSLSITLLGEFENRFMITEWQRIQDSIDKADLELQFSGSIQKTV